MTDKVTMYPTKVTQPNRNKASGLQGKCFKAVRRNGTSYEVNCRDQKDPKYHHEWSNAEEILKGNTIQCGRKSTKMCSHSTYYGIAGYRNTCPIAGVTGTYTQPATLRVFFNLSKKGISSSAKIKKVEISFEHRCTGVDVSNGKESTGWGPNFDGAKIYPSRKPLTVKIGSEKKSSGSNPPLSKKFSGTGNFTFTNVTYTNLVSDGVDIIYGNNLETNPGNIYLRNLKAVIHYDDGTEYISGTQSSDSLYVSDAQKCKTFIDFTIEAGYKQGSTKVPVNKAPKNLRDLIECDYPGVYAASNHPTDSRKKIFTISEDAPGKKTINFFIKGTKKKISFDYTAITRPKPTITIPDTIERNVNDNTITSIIASDGCANRIDVYLGGISSDSFLYKFESLNISNQSNIIPETDRQAFYKKIALLPCGTHKLIFKIDYKTTVIKYIEIIPTQHSFEFLNNKGIKIDNIETIQDKSKNEKIKLVFKKTKELFEAPTFKITNPTHGKIESNNIPTKQIIDDIIWGKSGKQGVTNALNKEGDSIDITIGTYYPGEYSINIEEEGCSKTSLKFKAKITPNHKQYFDEIFVRGEDSTAFDYDYLVAFEGDSITEPIMVNTVELGASFNDIKICTKESEVTGIGEIKSLDLIITNESHKEETIQNLMLELNPLVFDEDGLIQASSQEWLNDEGIFYNFVENFDNFNRDHNGLVSIKNLTFDEDNVDEESVYLHILQLNYNEPLTIRIPFGSFVEKHVLLQILAFDEPFVLSECGSTSLKQFDKIDLRVYDSIATNMDITGETDLFSTEIVDKCPQECFKTKIEYSIKNVDTSNAEPYVLTKIYNDPRLVPYMYEYKGIKHENIEGGARVSFSVNQNDIKSYNITGERISAYIKFENHDEIILNQYTDYNGEALFYVNIPQTVDGTYSVEQLLDKMSIEYKGNMIYNFSKLVTDNYTGDNRSYSFYQNKNSSEIINITQSSIQYKAGQVVPIRVKLVGRVKYLKNEISFSPDIIYPGDKDSLIVYYKICNLENNEGKISTKFITDDYRLISNELTKNIYCGMDTDIQISTKITKTIVENRSINRLHLSLNNKNRDNKNVRVLIKEINPIEKYDIIDSELDKGSLSIQDKNLLWTIDYIEENTVINGYIDLRAKEIGCSIIGTEIKDFIDDFDPRPKFGKESYECPCRR